MKSTSRLLSGAVIAGLAALALAGCGPHKSITPTVGDYAIVVGGGGNSNQTIHHVVDPAQHIKVPTGDRRYFLPASDRDYVTRNDISNPDRAQGAQGYTRGGSASGGQPALNPVAVYTYDRVPFVLNPNHAVIEKFFDNMCSKYGWQEGGRSSPNCAATSPGDFNGVNNLSATAGWIDLLNANMASAIDSATQYADQQFGPDLWHDGGLWGKYAEDVAKALPAALQKAMGSGSDHYFCGYGSTKTFCAPFTVQIYNIVPADTNVIRAYQQAAQAAYSAQAAKSRASVAQALYGDQAHYWTGLEDLVKQCGSNCPTIVIGNPQGVGVPGK